MEDLKIRSQKVTFKLKTVTELMMISKFMNMDGVNSYFCLRKALIFFVAATPMDHFCPITL